MRGSQEFAVVALAVSVALGGIVYSRAEHRDLLSPFTMAAAEIAHLPQRVALQAANPLPPPQAPPATQPKPAPLTVSRPAPDNTDVDPASDVPEGSVSTYYPPEVTDAVARRVLTKVPPNLLQYFDLFLYVSKAGEGTWAQHIFIFHRESDGSLTYEDSWPVSTGREQREKYFTDTPSGLFELDPNRFQPMHISHTWHGARMPWSMFLNYQRGSQMVGIALHAAIGRREDGDLGHRASGGCVRLPLARINGLYHRIQADEAGLVPVFAFDEARNTTSVSGEVEQDAEGNDELAEGYKVLLIIEDYPGESAGPALVSQNRPNPWAAGRRFALDKFNQLPAPDRDKGFCFG